MSIDRSVIIMTTPQKNPLLCPPSLSLFWVDVPKSNKYMTFSFSDLKNVSEESYKGNKAYYCYNVLCLCDYPEINLSVNSLLKLGLPILGWTNAISHYLSRDWVNWSCGLIITFKRSNKDVIFIKSIEKDNKINRSKYLEDVFE